MARHSGGRSRNHRRDVEWVIGALAITAWIASIAVPLWAGWTAMVAVEAVLLTAIAVVGFVTRRSRNRSVAGTIFGTLGSPFTK